MLASKSTHGSLKGFPQSTVVMATHSKGANLKRPNRVRIAVHQSSFSSSFFNQSSAVTRKVLRSKLPPVARELILWGDAFALCNCDITPALFDRGAECICCWTPSKCLVFNCIYDCRDDWIDALTDKVHKHEAIPISDKVHKFENNSA